MNKGSITTGKARRNILRTSSASPLTEKRTGRSHQRHEVHHRKNNEAAKKIFLDDAVLKSVLNYTKNNPKGHEEISEKISIK